MFFTWFILNSTQQQQNEPFHYRICNCIIKLRKCTESKITNIEMFRSQDLRKSWLPYNFPDTPKATSDYTLSNLGLYQWNWEMKSRSQPRGEAESCKQRLRLHGLSPQYINEFLTKKRTLKSPKPSHKSTFCALFPFNFSRKKSPVTVKDNISRNRGVQNNNMHV